MNAIDLCRLTIGDPLRKMGGDYQANGFYAGIIIRTDGALLCAFEFAEPARMVHIFRPEQVEPGHSVAPLPGDETAERAERKAGAEGDSRVLF